MSVWPSSESPEGETLRLEGLGSVLKPSARPADLFELPGFDEQFPQAGLLGEGGWGKVISAHRQGQQVAVKILNPQHSQRADRDRFAQEFSLLKRLQHPALVQAVEWGEWSGHLFYSMELIGGAPFLTHLRRHPEQLRPLFRQLLETLHYIHSEGVVHRDLKSSNLLVEPHGRLRLLDFGIARDLTSQRRHTSTGTVIGTPAYMAPEQLLNAQLDERTDLYAVGVLMYEAILGHQPFEAEEIYMTLIRVLDEVPDLSELPESTRGLVGALLQKRPADRPKSAREALERWNALG